MGGAGENSMGGMASTSENTVMCRTFCLLKLTVKTERLVGRTSGDLSYWLSLPSHTYSASWDQCLASSAYQFQHLYVGGKVPPLCTSSACFTNNVIIGKCFVKSRHETTLRRMCDWCYYCFPETYICFIYKFKINEV